MVDDDLSESSIDQANENLPEEAQENLKVRDSQSEQKTAEKKQLPPARSEEAMYIVSFTKAQMHPLQRDVNILNHKEEKLKREPGKTTPQVEQPPILEVYVKRSMEISDAKKQDSTEEETNVENSSASLRAFGRQNEDEDNTEETSYGEPSSFSERMHVYTASRGRVKSRRFADISDDSDLPPSKEDTVVGVVKPPVSSDDESFSDFLEEDSKRSPRQRLPSFDPTNTTRQRPTAAPKRRLRRPPRKLTREKKVSISASEDPTQI